MQLEKNAAIGFRYHCNLLNEHGDFIRAWEQTNLFPIQGRNHILDSAIGGGTQIGSWYVGLFSGNYTPDEADVMSTFPGLATEVTAYIESNRVALQLGSASAGGIDNTGNVATFTFTAALTIYGGFITSSLTKGATSGVLLSAARFSSPQSASIGNVLQVSTGCTLVNI